MKYRNIIFDLYGTLIDIHTNEKKPSLWKKMVDIYAVYRARYSWKEMRSAYFRMVGEEERILQEQGIRWPEIQLETVFRRLYLEKIQGYGTETVLINDSQMDTWLHLIANTFRILSRETFRLYPNTTEALDRLKQNDCRLFLLSNAQAAFTRPEISVTGLTPYFEGIYLSSDHGVRKPEPAFLRKMLDEYDLDPEETVIVGNDIYTDMVVADACGIDGMLLNTWHEAAETIREKMSEAGIRRTDRISIIISGDIRDGEF